MRSARMRSATSKACARSNAGSASLGSGSSDALSPARQQRLGERAGVGHGTSLSMPSMNGRSASGTTTLPVFLLVVLEHRHQRAADRQPRSVQRVHQLGPACALRYRACMRRAWKASQFDTEEISR